jgi:hypothetical protein
MSYVLCAQYTPQKIKDEIKNISKKTGVKMYAIFNDLEKHREEIIQAGKQARENITVEMYEKLLIEIKSKYNYTE